MNKDNDPVFIEFHPTEIKPWDAGHPPGRTFDGNLLAWVFPEGIASAHRFLIGMKSDGWYVICPSPFQPEREEEWLYAWLGPYPTREGAIQALPDAIEQHVSNVEDQLTDLLEHAAWMRKHPEHWSSLDDIPNNRIWPTIPAPAGQVDPALQDVLSPTPSA